MYSIKKWSFCFLRLGTDSIFTSLFDDIQCSEFTAFDTIIQLNKSLLERNIAEQYRILSVVLCWLLIPFKTVQAK